MRGINLLNVALGNITKGNLQVVNPYLTENQTVVLNKDLYDKYLEALENVSHLMEFDKDVVEELKSKEYRSKNTSLKYRIIGLWECIRG